MDAHSLARRQCLGKSRYTIPQLSCTGVGKTRGSYQNVATSLRHLYDSPAPICHTPQRHGRWGGKRRSTGLVAVSAVSARHLLWHPLAICRRWLASGRRLQGCCLQAYSSSGNHRTTSGCRCVSIDFRRVGRKRCTSRCALVSLLLADESSTNTLTMPAKGYLVEPIHRGVIALTMSKTGSPPPGWRG